MIIAKEKLEDMKWLEELLELYPKRIGHTKLGEIAREIKAIRHKIATYDYAPLEARRQASIKRLGKHSVYY